MVLYEYYHYSEEFIMGSSPGDAGFVYLLEWRGEYKIGISRNVPKRVRGMEREFPGIVVRHTFRSYAMRYAEMRLHERFRHCRVRKEWFAFTPGEVREICSYQDYQWDTEFIRRRFERRS
jgi:hypothetical protein